MLRTILFKSNALKTTRSLASNIEIKSLKQFNNNDNKNSNVNSISNNNNNDTDAGVGVNKSGGSGSTIAHRQLELDKVSIKFINLCILL